MASNTNRSYLLYTFTKGSDYTTNDLYNEKINEKVGLRILNLAISYYSNRGFSHFDYLALGINSYAMGYGNTERGKIYYTYVSNIIPEYYPYFIERRTVTNKGTKVLKIKSLYPHDDINTFLQLQDLPPFLANLSNRS